MPLKGRIARIWDAIDSRTGISGVARYVAGHEVRGGARYAYAFGSALLFAFILQIITGVTLASVYAPSVTDAWGSVYYIQYEMTFGWLVRGVHHFGSSAMIVLCVLHMTQVFFFGAHKKPRELNWILGVVMLLVVMGFGLTGYLLPWDQKGYWATQVATGIVAGTPGGELLQTVLQGGHEYGNATLTRFYALHVFVLPGALIALVVGHLALFYRHGVRTSPRVRNQRPSQTFWPYQMLRDLVVAVIVLGLLICLTVLVGVSLEAPADPASGYNARPEWYFLPLFQLLKYFEEPIQWVGTVIIPGLAVGFLLAVPFLDREKAERHTGPSRRVVIPYALIMVGAGVLMTLALAGDAGDEGFQKERAAAALDAERAAAAAKAGGIDASGRILLFEGPKLYVEHGCASCHDDDGEPAPLLSGYGSRERLLAFLGAPNSPRFFGGTALEGEMDAVTLPEPEMSALTSYLLSLGGASDADAASLAAGRAAFIDTCTDCHNDPALPVHHADYDATASGPDLAGLYGYEWTRGLIRQATHPRYYGASLTPAQRADSMPDYLDLSATDLDILVRWLLASAPGAK